MVLPEWSVLDRAAASIILPLAIWILLSGFDDLLVDVMAVLASARARITPAPPRRDLLREDQQRIAIFIPCWHESGVIADMISANRDRVQYRNYDFFIGTYPNDEKTIQAVAALETRFPNVHMALCAHPGPTSKADCLNWIYQRMILFEQLHRVRFDIIVTHDAEDVIHPDSLHWINWYIRDYDMVQVPVLPIPTRVTLWTHGVYCDEFTEYQHRDMPARQFMGAFVPSNGVGTGFRREALDALAETEGNRIFEPVCLTEDYENGLRLKLRGAKQIFIPVHRQGVATREYFPLRFRDAVKQRTRWVTGIALQTWARHGWHGSIADKYWLWRDRKGLVGNPASLLTNVLCVYGAIAAPVALVKGIHWETGDRLAMFAPLFAFTSAVGLYRMLYRGFCVGKNFGWTFALGVPVRVAVANLINSLATARAVSRFTMARLQSQPLRWMKTEHLYPSGATLAHDRRLFGEVLVMNGYITDEQLRHGLDTKPADRRLGEHLVSLGYLTEDDVYEALSLQTQIPQTHVTPGQVTRQVARALPAGVSRDLKVLPFRVEAGELQLATSDIPEPSLREELRKLTNLEIRIHLVTPTRMQELMDELL